MNNLEKLTKIIIEAVPEINNRQEKSCRCTDVVGDTRYINLEDVLRACKFNYQEWSAGNHDKIIGLLEEWQLGKNLPDQKPEVWDFLLSILDKTK